MDLNYELCISHGITNHNIVFIFNSFKYVASFLVTKGRHEIVPKDIREEAEKYAKVNSLHENTWKYILMIYIK